MRFVSTVITASKRCCLVLQIEGPRQSTQKWKQATEGNLTYHRNISILRCFVQTCFRQISKHLAPRRSGNWCSFHSSPSEVIVSPSATVHMLQIKQGTHPQLYAQSSSQHPNGQLKPVFTLIKLTNVCWGGNVRCWNTASNVAQQALELPLQLSWVWFQN